MFRKKPKAESAVILLRVMESELKVKIDRENKNFQITLKNFKVSVAMKKVKEICETGRQIATIQKRFNLLNEIKESIGELKGSMEVYNAEDTIPSEFVSKALPLMCVGQYYKSDNFAKLRTQYVKDRWGAAGVKALSDASVKCPEVWDILNGTKVTDEEINSSICSAAENQSLDIKAIEKILGFSLTPVEESESSDSEHYDDSKPCDDGEFNNTASLYYLEDYPEFKHALWSEITREIF